MLTSIRIKNFKAIKDTGELKLSPLTCFIGYNGSGKSSLLESLLTFKELVSDGLDASMNRWKGFENIQYKGVSRKVIDHKRLVSQDVIKIYDQPISFKISCKKNKNSGNQALRYSALSSITKTVDDDKIIFLEETLKSSLDFTQHNRDSEGNLFLVAYNEKVEWAYHDEKNPRWRIAMNTSLFSDRNLQHDIWDWQFLRMNPDEMGEPFVQKRTTGFIPLNITGNNIAEYLLSIKEIDINAYESILNTMITSVLPYASDLQSEITSAVDRKIFLNLTEKNYKIPGWLLSTGTLRIVALLAVFRHPSPAPIVIIEELENGLDPRSIHLIISEIRNFIENTGSQVIFTTHSPYLLDLMNLDEIIFAEKTDSTVNFIRPSSNKEIVEWAEKFTPGKLYTMSRLNTKNK
jgi:predicted ATPase